jgi:hypothetical protein
VLFLGLLQQVVEVDHLDRGQQFGGRLHGVPVPGDRFDRGGRDVAVG